MAKFRIANLADLARQLLFTPREARLSQVSAAEQLLHEIDPDKPYPPDFVIYRITGYRPRQATAELLAGSALRHDLGLLIEQVSDSLDLATRDLAEPVLSIDDLCEKLNVTSKTIQRWRRRGLPARRLMYCDGKRRMGFLLSSVERFLLRQGSAAASVGNFAPIGSAEQSEILLSARRLAAMGCCGEHIARRIARKFTRSRLAIEHVIRKHDQENPCDAILAKAPASLTQRQQRLVLRASARGVPLLAIAQRLGRPRTDIYWVVLDQRIAQLKARRVRFIDDPLLHQSDAEATLDALAAAQELPEATDEDLRVPRDLPPYFQDLYRTPLLGPGRERAMFLKYNFERYRFVAARRRLDPELARGRDLSLLHRLLQAAMRTRNAIVRANLRLVVSVARKHTRGSLSLLELISDGNIALMRAVDSFDIGRGNRFSTYATFALMKGFARSVPQMLAAQRLSGVDQKALADIRDHRPVLASARLVDRDEVRQLLERLDCRERRIVAEHYGLDADAPASYEQLGHRLGLSKERVRQIERAALAKLRAAAMNA